MSSNGEATCLEHPCCVVERHRIFAAVFSSGSSQRPSKASGLTIFRRHVWHNSCDPCLMHEVIATVSPKTALSVGLKVDVEALLTTVIAVARWPVNLDDPAVTPNCCGSTPSSA